MIFGYECIYKKFKCTKIEYTRYSKRYKYVSIYYDI